MFKLSKILCLLLVAFSTAIVTNCTTDQAKKTGTTEEISPEETQLLKEQNVLYELACRDFSDINQKVVDLNRKITSMTGKLTEEQNAAIDEIESKRSSISARMKTVKNIPQADWENFKSTLEQDISETRTKLDELLSGIK